MSQREVRRAAVLSRVVEGELKLVEAAVLSNISYRQAKRLYKRFRASGAAGLVHGNAGRRSNRARAVVEQERVLELVRKFYSGPEEKRFGPTLASEHLLAEHGIGVSPETLRRWMLVGELWSRVRRRRPYRKYRERKAHFGELLQIDGSLHDWFEGRRAPAWLVTLVDDATGTTVARFSEGETTWAAVEVLKAWIGAYGVPHALYSDWNTVYLCPRGESAPSRTERPLSQFGRMCWKLGVEIHGASSPQAKGRVERNHGVHQDRLVKKMRLKGIRTLEAANEYLEREYLAEHNRRFALVPREPADFHLSPPWNVDLDRSVWCLEHERTVGNDWVVSFQGKLLQIGRGQGLRSGSKVTVRQWRDGRLGLYYRRRAVEFNELLARPARACEASKELASRVRKSSAHKPAANHPWRQFSTLSAKAQSS